MNSLSLTSSQKLRLVSKSELSLESLVLRSSFPTRYTVIREQPNQPLTVQLFPRSAVLLDQGLGIICLLDQ